MRDNGKGWYNESKRHSLSSRGIKTGKRTRTKTEFRSLSNGDFEGAPDIKSYNGYPLKYAGSIPIYNSEGERIGDAVIGRDSDGNLCLEDGRYTGGSMIDGEVYYFYQRHGDVAAIKRSDIKHLD